MCDGRRRGVGVMPRNRPSLTGRDQKAAEGADVALGTSVLT